MSSRTKTNAIALATVVLALVAVLVAGCSMHRWAQVEPGEYAVVHGGAATTMTVARQIQKLDIDRDESLMVLTLVDGSEIAASFVPRDRTEWPAGCPTNIHSTRMEVLDIVQDPLTIGATSLSRPIVIRDCPPEPVRIVLRKDGAIGGGGSACPSPEPCIVFSPQATASPFPMPLPHSPKGYELYSWPSGKEWYFTLITGTNRLKTYEEIVSPANVVTETDWVKLSVKGIENLQAVLNRLPKGEEVVWIGEGWLADVGAPESDIQLPSPKVINQIESHCHRLAIRLQVTD